MLPSLRVFAANVHRPLIKFLGKRKWPSTPDMPHVHPAAPPELKKRFSDFGGKFKDSSVSSASLSSPLNTQSKGVFPDFWEAPDRFWRPKVRELDAIEIDAISSGGASLR